MGDEILARRYANAILEIAEENGIISQVESGFNILSKIVSENNQWIDILDDIEAPLGLRQKMIDQFAEASRIDKYLIKLLKLLVDKRRCFLLPAITDFYKKLMMAKRGEIEVFVTFADETLWPPLEDEIVAAISKLSGKTPIIKRKTDPSIIGGITIKIGDKLYDGSIKGELRRVKNHIMEGANEIFRRL